MILYDPLAMAKSAYTRALQTLAAREAVALDFGDLSTSFYAALYRAVVRRALEAELSDPTPPDRPIAHCLMCQTYRNKSGGGVL